MIKSAATLQNRHHLGWNAIAIQKIGPALVVLMTLSVSAPQLHPQTETSVRTPLGVFAHLSIEDALKRCKGSSNPTEDGSAPMQYVEVDYVDVQYAQDPKNKCQTFLPSMLQGPPSLQDYYNLASYDLLTMAGKPATLPPTTCKP